MELKFREFLAEAFLSDRKRAAYGLNRGVLDGVIQKDFAGWQVFFVDRYNDHMAKFAEFLWQNEYHAEEVFKQVFDSKVSQDLLHKNLAALDAANTYTNEEGWSSTFFHPRPDHEGAVESIKNTDFAFDEAAFDSGPWLDRFSRWTSYDEKTLLHIAKEAFYQEIMKILERQMDTAAADRAFKLLHDHGPMPDYSVEHFDINGRLARRHFEDEGRDALARYAVGQIVKKLKEYTGRLQKIKKHFNQNHRLFTDTFYQIASNLNATTFTRLWQEYRKSNPDAPAYFNVKITPETQSKTGQDLYFQHFRYGYDGVNSQLEAFHDIFERQIQRLISMHPMPQADFDDFIHTGMRAVQKVVSTVMTLGVRNYHRVPIIFYYQNEGEPSGFGTNNYAAGKAFKDRIALYGVQPENEMISTLSHEIGHIVFDRLSYQDQVRVRNLAHDSGVLPRDYGSPKYLYPGSSHPGIHHASGNEWFATAVEYLALGGQGYFNTPQTPEQQQSYDKAFRQVRQTLATAPNFGTGYKINNPLKVARPPRRLQPRKVTKSGEPK